MSDPPGSILVLKCSNSLKVIQKQFLGIYSRPGSIYLRVHKQVVCYYFGFLRRTNFKVKVFISIIFLLK